jgi:iron complex outermembrane receptor protein
MFNCLKVFLICFLVWPGVSLAETDKRETDRVPIMPEVVVTATRSEQRIERVPANVTVITEEDIKRSTAKTVPDLLRYEEGVTVRDQLGNGKFVSVDLRGFGETASYNTLVLVDGRRVNDIDLSGVDWTQISLEQIERIEIVRGTGTVLYGDNAVGGVINIITKTPSEKLKATAAVVLGSYNFKKGTASVAGGHNDVKGSLLVSYQDTDGYRENNHYRAGDIGGKIIYDVSEVFGLNLSGSYHDDVFGLPGPLTAGQLETDRKQKQDAFSDNGESKDRYLKIGAEWELTEFGSVEMDLSYRIADSEALFNGAIPFLQKNDKKIWGFTPRYLWEGNIFNNKNTIIAGIDIYRSYYKVNLFSGTPLSQFSTGNSDRDSLGIYFHDELYLSNDLIFSFGARHEKVNYDLKTNSVFSGSLDDSVKEDENAFNAGLTYLYQKRSSLFARINRSFRFPLADDMIEYPPPTFQVQLNSDLKPQTGMHYELGIRHYFSSMVEAGFTLFRINMKDEILLDKATNPFNQQNINHPGTLHQGIEVGCKVSPSEELAIYGNYTYESATFEKEPFKGNDIPAVPNHKANLGLSIHNITPGLMFYADYNYVGSSYAISDMANQFNKLDAYYAIDVKFTYKYKSVHAYAGIKNLTDQKYSEYAVIGGTPIGVNYYPAPERNYFAGIEFIF